MRRLQPHWVWGCGCSAALAVAVVMIRKLSKTRRQAWRRPAVPQFLHSWPESAIIRTRRVRKLPGDKRQFTGDPAPPATHYLAVAIAGLDPCPQSGRENWMVKPQTFSLAQLRRLGPLFLALFVLAQATGIAPLMSTHIQHAFENERDVAADLGESGRIDHVHHHHAYQDNENHEHGASDRNDQCCTLHHHLAGVIPMATGPGQSGLTLSVVAMSPPSLIGTHPSRLERPPKLQLLI